MRFQSFRRPVIIVSSVIAVLATSFGIYSAIRSPLFLVRVVEVADQPENSPVDAATILKLAAVDTGKISLFELDLPTVEKRILTHPWIKEVHLEKRFPQTLSIGVTFREAKALVQSDKGQLSYVDADGRFFGTVSLLFQPDLPILSGLERNPKQVPQAIEILKRWESARTSLFSQIAELDFDSERGFRAWITYPMQRQSSDGRALSGRSVVDLGLWGVDSAQQDLQLERMGHVLEYLSNKSVNARQIWADAGKKIVVKTARGS